MGSRDISACGIVKALLAEIRFVPMTLVVLTVLLGGVVAGPTVDWGVMSLVLANSMFFLYVAHLNDTFFDLKSEYEPNRVYHNERIDESAYLARVGFGTEIPGAPLLNRSSYLIAIIICSLIGLGFMLAVQKTIGGYYSLLAIVGLVLALSYSAGLDKLPAVGDTMWEIGVVFALFCGYYSQKLMLDMFIVIFATPLFMALIGVKALDGWYDIPVDNKKSKMTLPVYLYRMGWKLEHIYDLAFAFIYLCFLMLMVMAPHLLWGELTALAITGGTHLLLRGRDMRVRLGITFVGIGIAIFIAYAIVLSIL